MKSNYLKLHLAKICYFRVLLYYYIMCIFLIFISIILEKVCSRLCQFILMKYNKI